MKYTRKIAVLSIFGIAGMLSLFDATPSRSTHTLGEQLITLDQMQTASIMELGTRYEDQKLFVSEVYKTDYAFQLLGLDWEQAVPEGTAAAMEVRFFSEDGVWTDWEPLAQDADHPSYDETGMWTTVLTEGSTAFQYRVFLSTENDLVAPKLSNVTFDYVDGGRKSALASLSKLIFRDDTEVVSRDDWGANEDLRLAKNYNVGLASEWTSELSDADLKKDSDMKIEDAVYVDENGDKLLWPLEYPKEIKKIIIHHTATSSNLKDPEVAVRAIYHYHAVTRGWGDIGYNFIVAPDGTVYEGRAGGDKVVAGHASGYNTGSVGIALLGNYERNSIPGDMMQGLTALIYEKAELYNIDPDGKVAFRGKEMPNILGHRDVDSTACPGNYTYDYIPDIRRLVANTMDEENSDGSKTYAFEEVTDRELLTLERETEAGVTIKIKNTGTGTWNSNTYLVVNSDTDAGEIVTVPKDSKKRTAQMKESSVKSGDTATFSFTVKATDVGGLAEYQMTPVFNGTEKTEQYMELGVYVDVPVTQKDQDSDDSLDSSDKASITGVFEDLIFEPGEKKLIWLKIKNTGTEAWSSSGSKAFTLAFSGTNGLDASVSKVSFKSLGAGASTKVYIKVTAPDEAGEYTLEIRPKLGGTNLTSKPYELDLTVGDEDFTESDYINPIRIKLTPDNEVENHVLTSKTTFAIYDDEELVNVFNANARVRITAGSKSFILTSGSSKWTVKGPVRAVPEEGGIMQISTIDQRASWDSSINDNKFRGTIEIREVNDEMILINELALEDYLKGLAEETNGTPTEKLKTMAILGRSYAYYYITKAEKFSGMPYDGEDDPNTFQKYLGYGYETRHPNVAEAAEDTKDLIVTYNGEAVKTPYFSKSDGVATKSAKEVWGWTNTPWLVSVLDPYCDSTAFSGHGVGLSGCGAKTLAEEGWTFEEIIKYYYTDVEITSL